MSHERTLDRLPTRINPEKEKLLHVGGIVIGGSKGTGKTTFLNILESRYGLAPADIGSKVRDTFEKKTGTAFRDARKRDLGDDLAVDMVQWELFKNADPTKPFSCHSWLAPFFLKTLKDEGLVPAPVPAILLYTDPPEIGINRAAERDAKKLGISIKQAVEENDRRFAKDWEQWTSLYPPLEGLDLYRPGAKDHDRNKFYDLEINTAAHPLEENIEILHRWLVKQGFVEPKRNNTNSGLIVSLNPRG